jgi:phospholipid/cholesterol/gamma-HCH transport system ATP-binding protein
MFLDEPTSGLDPVTAEEIDELVLTLNRNLGTTLVIVTHDLASIERTVGRCILLDDTSRSIVAEGDPRRLRAESTDPRVRDFFHRTERRA